MAVKKRKVRSINSAQQHLKIARYFPQFKSSRNQGGVSTWKGILCPGEGSPQYLVKIQIREGFRPKVWVLEPPLVEKPPHVYEWENNSLCLFYPKNNEWTDRDFIADKTIPWTAEWLKLYEIWIATGKWFGPEIGHGPNGKD